MINKIMNILTSIAMFPVILVAMVGVTMYWVCKFPFWYVERKKWYRIDK